MGYFFGFWLAGGCDHDDDVGVLHAFSPGLWKVIGVFVKEFLLEWFGASIHLRFRELLVSACLR